MPPLTIGGDLEGTICLCWRLLLSLPSLEELRRLEGIMITHADALLNYTYRFSHGLAAIKRAGRQTSCDIQLYHTTLEAEQWQQLSLMSDVGTSVLDRYSCHTV